MRLEKYDLEFNSTRTAFEFISKGPKGQILKRVEYSKIKYKDLKNIYNLGFGDINLDSEEIDDTIITDNQDREKVIATVASTVFIFIKRHPKAKIIIRGSNKARIRLYRMAISKYFDELSETFDIQGYSDKNWLFFEKNIDYSAFLISRKIF